MLGDDEGPHLAFERSTPIVDKDVDPGIYTAKCFCFVPLIKHWALLSFDDTLNIRRLARRLSVIVGTLMCLPWIRCVPGY